MKFSDLGEALFFMIKCNALKISYYLFELFFQHISRNELAEEQNASQNNCELWKYKHKDLYGKYLLFFFFSEILLNNKSGISNFIEERKNIYGTFL